MGKPRQWSLQMKRLLLPIVLALVVGVGACATMESGTNFDMAVAQSFEVGKATRNDIEAKLGAPSSVTENSDGSSMLVYVHIASRGNGLSGKASAESRSVAYRFSADQVLAQTTVQRGTSQSQ